MNRFYRHIWSKTLGQAIVVPECAGGGAGRKAGRRRGGSLVALMFMLAALPGGTALADTNWTGAVDGDWFNAANWTNGVPANTGAFSNINGPVTAVVGAPGGTTEDRTSVGSGSGVSGSVTIENGGTLTTGCCFYLGNNGGTGTMTVSGTGTVTAPNIFMIGNYTSTGHLTIENGGTVNSGSSTFVGRWDGSTGFATVTGQDSVWNTSWNLTLAGELPSSATAYGELTISDGGLVRVNSGNSALRIGYAADSTGLLNIGAAEGDLAAAAGMLQASSAVFGAGNSSIVFNHTDTGYIFSTPISGNGEVRQLAGTTILTGANSWSGGTTISGGMLAGNTTSLVGDILNNATLAFDQSADGSFSGAVSGTGSLVKLGNGVLTLTGTNSYGGGTTVSAGTLRAGNATAFVAGTAYTVNGGTLDFNDFSRTIAALSGTGGTVDLGSATLTVDQSVNTVFAGAIGGSGGLVKSGAGTLSLTGASVWTGDTSVDAGTLGIAGGGTVSNTFGYIGASAGGTGEVTVDGADSIWTNSDELYVGNSGTGTLGITDGGAVSIGTGYIGRNPVGTGDVTVDGAGSTWTNSYQLNVGEFGTGTLGIADGGAVSNTNGYIGVWAGGTGEVTVDGAGSTWTNSYQLNVGYYGTGTLGIAGGGTVSNTSGVIGYDAGGSGAVTVDGADSTWTNSDQLIVGNSGTGTLGIAGGGTVSNTEGYIGRNSGSTGEVTVDGAGSTWANSDQLIVGNSGTGTLGITGGGTVSNTWEGYIGALAGGTGEVTVSGAGSTWTNSDQLYVGNSGTGTLTLSDGGRAEAAAVTIANNAASTGTLNIGAASGDAAVAAGTLDAASVVFGDGTGTLVFNHMDSDYLFAAGISGAGEVLVENGETVLTAAATHTGGTTISGGTLQLGNGGATGSVSGGIVNDGTLAIDRSNAFTWAGVMSGSGDFRQLGSGATTLTGDSSAFAGATFVDAGALIVNGLLGGTLDVGAGRLGGSGTVGTTALGAGAIFAPGNSIGTLNVSGDLLFGSLSIYEVELDDRGNAPGVNNDFIDVAGALTIDSGASVSVRPENGTDDGSTYTPGLVYTILSAANGITGAFDAVTASFAFLTPSLDYDANNVYLTLDIVADFQDVAQTPNQQGVANTVQTFGPGNTLYDGLLGLTEDQARSAFNSLSGEAHASASTSPLPGMQQIRQQILDRLARIFGGGFGGFGSAAAKQAPAAGDAPAPGHAVWGQLFGSWGKTDGNAVSAAIDRDSYGFIGGADREIAPGVHAGVALGYSRSTWDVSARSSSGDSDNFHIAGYAGTALGAVDLKGVVSYAYGRADTDRTVIVGVLTNELSASYATHTFQAGIEAGYDLDMGPVVLTPFAGLAGVHVETEGFTETGGPAALTFASTGNTTGVTTLGLRARHQAGSVGLTGAAAWRHAFGDVEPTSRAAFASSPAATFAVRGAPLVRDALAVEGGFEARIDRAATLSFGYSGEYSSDTRDHALMAELRVEF